ncbi:MULTISPECIES: WGxxGxxG family protein [unclassified Paenibacillus]|uniref:WGxxGxxG family protein n=1 Tax=unclassified Paenibacillus TaxID=185978 RepID=UPI002F408228
MKKICSFAFTFTVLLSLLSSPAYALDNNQTNVIQNIDLTTHQMNNYKSSDGGMDGYRVDGRSNINNYRTSAVDNNRGTNWSWIGLLGLAGLFGLRNRERERS